MLANVSVNFYYDWKDCTVVTWPPTPLPPPGTLPPAAVGIATAVCNYSSNKYDPSPTVWDVALKQSYLALQTLTRTLDGMHGERFGTEFCTRGCHWIPRVLD
jgi:hypothetical protein